MSQPRRHGIIRDKNVPSTPIKTSCGFVVVTIKGRTPELGSKIHSTRKNSNEVSSCEGNSENVTSAQICRVLIEKRKKRSKNSREHWKSRPPGRQIESLVYALPRVTIVFYIDTVTIRQSSSSLNEEERCFQDTP